MPAGPRTIISVVGARPNFMKLAPVARALARRPAVRHVIVHTGQHYDAAMSDAFFTGLRLPRPDFTLAVGSGSHAAQTAAVLQRFEPVCDALRPDLVLVYGDVNSTLAAALAAAKLGYRVGHVEAGLRSRDWSMPEEINRVLTDRLADLLFTPSRDAAANLLGEGIAPDRIHFVGNVMIDALVACLGSDGSNGDSGSRLPAPAARYVVVTLHRPANVDDPAVLAELLDALVELAETRPVVFPVHPRTRARICALGWRPPAGARVALLDPLPYGDMLQLVLGSELVITDSGGLQEETSFLGIPCLTVRSTTERPVTCTAGTNRLVPPPLRRATLLAAAGAALAAGRRWPPPAIERWDGKAAERIAAVSCGEASETAACASSSPTTT